MWKNNLEKKSLDVDKCKPLKYLSTNEVKNLQLQVLGCPVDTILIRKEYAFTVKALEDLRFRGSEGAVVGSPGIGTSFLHKVMSRTS